MKKWNEMNQSERIIYIIALVFCAIGFVFAVRLCARHPLSRAEGHNRFWIKATCRDG